MELALVEKVEKMEEITHQEPSQEERNSESGLAKPDGQNKKCGMDYLAIREANIAENRRERLRLGLLEEEKPKQAAVKRKKLPMLAPTRRSSRVKELPKVNYDDEDWEVEHFGKRRRKVVAEIEKVVEEEPKRKSPRELMSVDYGLMDANMDEEIFCNGCEQWIIPPCQACGECGMQFVHPDKLKLEVVLSKVGGAGQGLINNGGTIVKGTMVGPYTGKFVSFDDYKQEEKMGRESGYAWLLYDSATMEKPSGYVDPGSAPDPALNKLAKANHPSKKQELSFVGCQFKGNIYYRAIKDVLRHQEVFVDYGPDYAAELGIDPSTFDTYTRPENHKTTAIICLSCNTPFSEQQFLDIHLKRCCKNKSSRISLDVSDKQVLVGGEVPCFSCSKLFSSKQGMMYHYRSAHLDEKVPCSDSSCSRVFSRNCHMLRHYRTIHLGQKAFKCNTCGQLFNQKANLKRHVDEVHLAKRPFICGDCGATFALAGALKRHVASKHSSAPPRFACTHPGCSVTVSTQYYLKMHMMDHTGERPFPCPYESCNLRFKCQSDVNRHIKIAKKHAGHRLASKIIDKYLLPFTCQVEGCINRYETEVERDRHMEKLHPST